MCPHLLYSTLRTYYIPHKYVGFCCCARRRMCCYAYPNPGYTRVCLLLLLQILLHAAINEFSFCYMYVCPHTTGAYAIAHAVAREDTPSREVRGKNAWPHRYSVYLLYWYKSTNTDAKRLVASQSNTEQPSSAGNSLQLRSLRQRRAARSS